VPPLEQGFQFNRFGVRVPTILVSPWIEAETVFRSLTDEPPSPCEPCDVPPAGDGTRRRTPYDHTSTIATILGWQRFNIPREKWGLGQRVAHAPTFEGVLRAAEARQDRVEVQVSEPYKKPADAAKTPFSDLQVKALPALLHQISVGKLSVEEAEAEAIKILKSAATYADLTDAVHRLASRFI
jgi:phospholipase C